jgi:TatD DNase family protein
MLDYPNWYGSCKVVAIQLADTHCHIHEAWRAVNGADATAKLWDKAGRPNADDIIQRAVQDGVTCMICVGTTLPDSQLAVEFAQTRPRVWASIGLHPHEAKDYANHPAKLKAFASLVSDQGWQPAGQHPPGAHEGAPGRGGRADRTPAPGKIVAVGECGLDYFYNHSSKQDQEKVLRFQIELALAHDLPLIFHVRDAFDDFWPIFDGYQNVRGVIHSFSAGEKELGEIIERGLYVGLNGIMTFTKHVKQLDAAKAVPSDRLLLETDAPFLTPQPFRGRICEPRHVRVTAEFLANLRGESLADLATATTNNARRLFGI